MRYGTDKKRFMETTEGKRMIIYAEKTLYGSSPSMMDEMLKALPIYICLARLRGSGYKTV